jgi:hypothetical protein
VKMSQAEKTMWMQDVGAGCGCRKRVQEMGAGPQPFFEQCLACAHHEPDGITNQKSPGFAVKRGGRICTSADVVSTEQLLVVV